jgi:hypothetical protein
MENDTVHLSPPFLRRGWFDYNFFDTNAKPKCDNGGTSNNKKVMDDNMREYVRSAACQMVENHTDMDINLTTPNLRFEEDLKFSYRDGSLNDFLTVYAELFETSFTSNEIKKIKTLGDLYALMEHKI